MSATRPPGDQYAGAGLSLASPEKRDDDGHPPKSQQSVASRAIALSSYFLSGALCINLSQFLGTPLYLINQDWYNSWIAFTKQSFGLLTMTLTQTFSPTKIIVSGDASVRGQILRNPDGTLLLDFPERIVLIANHQIYTDWLYLWWTAYCRGMHGRLYIILKESLKKIPIIGWGMQFSQFIFLKRNWERDRDHMAQALGRLNKLADPMWLLIFPEGTNLARSTRERSAKWAAKNKMKDMRHCLLPRSTGLRFCLQELQSTVDYLYDCTLAYEGVPRGAYAQDIFTLKAGYLEGRPPKSVSMYWRRFRIKDIPFHNDKAFELWLTARWREKDLLIENYLIHGRFPADSGISRTPTGQLKRGAGRLEAEIKSAHWYEFLQIFAPMGILAMVLYCFYGALPQKFFSSETGKAVEESTQDIQALKRSTSAPSLPTSFDLDTLFDKEKQEKTFGNAGVALAQFMQGPEAKRLIDRADLVQKWLQDPQKVLIESITGGVEKENYLKALKEEENRRKRLGNKHQGTFWDDLGKAESKSSTQAAKGTFYKDLATAKAARKGSGPDRLSHANLNKRSSFWDDLNKESNRRTGTVFTLPTLSSSDSRTAIESIATISTAVASKTGRASVSQTLPKQAVRNGTGLTQIKGSKSVSTASNSSPAPKKLAITKAPSTSKSGSLTTTKTPAKLPAASNSSPTAKTSTNHAITKPKKLPPAVKTTTSATPKSVPRKTAQPSTASSVKKA